MESILDEHRSTLELYSLGFPVTLAANPPSIIFGYATLSHLSLSKRDLWLDDQRSSFVFAVVTGIAISVVRLDEGPSKSMLFGKKP